MGVKGINFGNENKSEVSQDQHNCQAVLYQQY
jgi:hypothetical protein